jgi:flavin-dependent dehydrogenase
LLENASRHGVELLTGSQVVDIVRQGKQIEGLRLKDSTGEEKNLTAPVIVDASGQSALIARKLGIRKQMKDLRKASIYTHFKGAHRDTGIDEGATIILQTREADSWFWYIPLPDDVVSVGVVGDIDYLLQNRNGADYQHIFNSELQLCPALKAKLGNARQLFPVKTTKDFSYRASQMAGDGWILVGDAYGFLDPIYSSGVFLALKSGEMAADAITEAFDKQDFSRKQLGKYESELLNGMTSIRNLIYAFYTKDFSFGSFLKEHRECTQDVVDILIGNVFDRDMNELFKNLHRMNVIPAN